MSYLRYYFKSKVLKMDTSITVTIPTIYNKKKNNDLRLDEIYEGGKKFPTLYLMHGGGGDSTAWLRRTNIELYGEDKGFMTVSMDLEESFCCDMKYGRAYFTYATEEVPRLVQMLFPSSSKREDNYVAGFSMGGHCAVKAALRCPERFGGVLGISGAKDVVKMQRLAAEMGIVASNDMIDYAFGSQEEIYGSENDLLALAKNLAESDRSRPDIWLTCGKQDYGFKLCKEYSEYLTDLGIKNTFFTQDGVHDWYFTDEALKRWLFEMLP